MAYRVYVDGVALPVTPERISIVTDSQNSRVNLIDGREISILRPPGLTQVSFEALLPNVEYPFATYVRGFRRAEYYLELLDRLRKKQKKFRLIISRTMQDGTLLHDTNLRVTLERADTEESDTDVVVSLRFRQYVDFGGKQTVAGGGIKAQVRLGGGASVAAGVRHVVVKGDCLWNLTHKYWQDGNRYAQAYEKNKTVIDAGNRGTGNPRYTIYLGQVLNF